MHPFPETEQARRLRAAARWVLAERRRTARRAAEIVASECIVPIEAALAAVEEVLSGRVRP